MKNSDSMKNNELPNVFEYEQAVLGAIILEEETYFRVSDTLETKSFYLPKHQAIFNTIEDLIKSRAPIDLIIVTQELKRIGKLEEVGGPEYITNLASKVTLAHNIEHYARIISQFEVARKIIRLISKYKQKAYNPSNDVFEVVSGLQNELTSMLDDGNQRENSIAEALKEIDEKIQKNRSANILTGIGTGLTKFDNFSGGLQSSDLIIIAAESSHGKTSLALTVLKNAVIKYRACVAVYSLEMSKSQLVSRIISQETKIPAKKILHQILSDADIEKIENVNQFLKNLPVYFDEQSTATIDSICSSVHKLVAKRNVNLVVVDYLQLVSTNLKNRSEENQIADIARQLKNLAKQLNITIIALSQLSRDRNNPRPKKNRLRGSGQIEEAADILLLLWRPELFGIKYFDGPFSGINTTGLAEVTIAKGRNIGTGSFLLRFDEHTTNFFDYD